MWTSSLLPAPTSSKWTSGSTPAASKPATSGASSSPRSSSRSGTSAARPRIVASSQQWATLRALSVHLPEVDTFYSVDVPAKLDLFRSVTDRDGRPAGVSCRHSLLTRALVRELIDRGLMVVAWTVDDPVRARELVEWGVHGITTHRVAEMRAEFGR